jgi:hypothetical protein
MAVPTNLASTYDLPLAIREDLQDFIYNVDPSETPFMVNVGQGVATATLHEWQTDSLAAPAQNAVLEGNNPTAQILTDTTKLTNQTQISEKTVVISETQLATDQAGLNDRMAYEMAKKLKELKRDMENDLVGLSNIKVAGAEGTAREYAGVNTWIATNTDFGASGADPTGDGTDIPTDGTQRAFTEAIFEVVIDEIWNSGGDPTLAIMGSFQKRAVTGFSGNATKFKDVDDRSVVNAVDVYESDYGQFQVVPDRYQRSREVILVDPDFWALHFLRPTQSRELSKTGDNVTRQIIVEYTLAALNEKSSGIIRDLTTS